MENEKQKKILFALIPIVIALLSFFVIARFTSSTEFNAKTIQSLDDKKTTVMELAAASTAASAAITLIPGDVGTPIANKLADLSSYFLIVLCAIYLEKYLVTITGYAAFKILVPIACLPLPFAGVVLSAAVPEIPAFRTGSVSCDPGEREGGGYDRDNLCVIHREYDRDCEADNR